MSASRCGRSRSASGCGASFSNSVVMPCSSPSRKRGSWASSEVLPWIPAFAGMTSSLAYFELSLGELPGGEIPIDELVEPCVDVIRTAVLVIQIIGVFPHVAGQQTGDPARHRRVGVRGLHDLELLVGVLDEPGPTAAELGHRGGGEFLAELRVVTKGVLDMVGDRAGRRPAAVRPHAVPVEGVVPILRRVVEDGDAGGIGGRRLD